jgi:hypothetical protein
VGEHPIGVLVGKKSHHLFCIFLITTIDGGFFGSKEGHFFCCYTVLYEEALNKIIPQLKKRGVKVEY